MVWIENEYGVITFMIKKGPSARTSALNESLLFLVASNIHTNANVMYKIVANMRKSKKWTLCLHARISVVVRNTQCFFRLNPEA